MDIASLGFRIDSSQAVKAAKDLDRLHDQAQRAEDAVQKLDQQIRRMKDIPPAVSERVDGSLSRAANRSSGDAGGGGGVEGSMERAAEGVENTGKASKVAADKVKEMRSELFELAKTVASGEASLGTFIEAGWKMGEIVMSSGASLGAWAQALGLTNPIVLAVVAAIGLAVGAFALFQSDLNKHAKDKAYLESLGFTKDEIDKLGKTTITAGDIFKGFWMTLDEGGRVTKVFEQIKTFAVDAFRGIVDGVMWVAAAIGGYFTTAFKAISYLFTNFPRMVADAFITAVNFGIKAINGFLKSTVDGFNAVGERINKFFGKQIFGSMDAFQIDEIGNKFAGSMEGYFEILKNITNEIKAGKAAMDEFGKSVEKNSFGVALANQTPAAADATKTGGVVAAASASASASATSMGGQCDCPDGAAQAAANDNSVSTVNNVVMQGGQPAEKVAADGQKALKSVADAAEDTTAALHPLRDKIAEIGEDLSKSLGQAIVNGEDLGDVMTATFKRIAAEWASQGIQKMFDGLIGKKGDAGTGILGGLFSGGGSGGSGGFLSKAAGFFGGLFSFDGGGYTGEGSRSGGMDGKGGFLAVMHPRETVVDHTKGSGGGGGGQPVQVAVSVTVDDDGKIRAYVRDSSARAVQTGISQYDAGMPQRVAAIGNDPRRR